MGDEQHEQELSVEQRSQPSMGAHAKAKSGAEAVRISREGADPRSASADSDASGSVEDSLVGAASLKEDSELRAARLLVEHLNEHGEAWQAAEPRQGQEDGVDCVAEGKAGSKLEMQVTTPEQHAWAALAKLPKLDRTEAIDDVVECIRMAIAKKMPKAHRSVVLVVDAADSPRHALETVVGRFRALHASMAAKSGFAAVWLVGSLSQLVHRLDV